MLHRFCTHENALIKNISSIPGCMFAVLVLLEGEPLYKSQVFYSLNEVFLQDCPVFRSNSNFIQFWQTSRSRKYPTQHASTATMLYHSKGAFILLDLHHKFSFKAKDFNSSVIWQIEMLLTWPPVDFIKQWLSS